MATSEGIPSSIDIEFLELNDNPYFIQPQNVSGRQPRLFWLYMLYVLS